MSHVRRLFAVIPAAGLSRRMGCPKLLLNLGGKSVMERLLQALNHPRITARLVVVRGSDLPLQEEVLRWRGSLVIPPIDPPDMRSSVAAAIDEIDRQYAPVDDDGWLLVPADHPVLDRQLIETVLEHWIAKPSRILVPRCGQRRGHPTLFDWGLAREVARIPADRGLNWLLREYARDVTELSVQSTAAITDLDTPEDFERLQRQWELSADAGVD